MSYVHVAPGPQHLETVIEGQKGLKQVHVYGSVGETLDLASRFGPDWFFGNWENAEAEWVRGCL